MIKKRTNTLYLFFFLLFAYSCQQKEENLPSLEKPIHIISQVLTRSAMESGFTTDDEIGVFMLNRTSANTPAVLNKASGNWLDNGYFRLDNNEQNWVSLAPVYWKDANTVMDVIGYYPYMDIETDIANNKYTITSVPFSIQTDQSEIEKLRISDFLYAEQRALTPQNAENGITLGFKHRLCKLTVHLKFKPDEITNADKITLIAFNVHYTGTINLNNGAITTNSELTSNLSFHMQSEQEAECILFPQQILPGKFLRVTLSGSSNISYEYSLTTPYTLEEGKEYIINFDCNIPNKESL